MTRNQRRRAGVVFAVVGATLLPLASGAQPAAWPDKPVKVVIPWAPGGITDILGRLMAQKLGQSLGQQFVVENKPGAGGNIGAELVARAPADGYTLLLTNPGAFATNQYLYAKMSYKPADFTGVILLAEFPNALMVHKDLPVQSVADLIDYARRNPAGLSAGSSGAGTSGHLSVEMFKAMTGVQIQNVFYKGAALSKLDLATGRIQVALDNIPGYLSELQSGTVRMLAVGTKARLASFPDTPTLDEAGVKGYQSSVWYALAAPRETPAAIVQKVNAAARAALDAADVQDRIRKLHGLVMSGSPEDANRFFADESQRWKTIIEKTGAKID